MGKANQLNAVIKTKINTTQSKDRLLKYCPIVAKKPVPKIIKVVVAKIGFSNIVYTYLIFLVSDLVRSGPEVRYSSLA